MHKTTAWDEAIDEGVVKGELRLLLTVGRQHLGEPDAKIEAALSAIRDPDRLDRMAAAIRNTKSWKSLLTIK